MSTIPFPNIAEQAGEVAATPINALQEYQRVAALKQQMQQSAAMAPLQQQQAQQQIQAQQRQFADQDALTKAITQYDPAKHTIADIPKLITSNGGSGQAALQAQAGLVTQRQNLLKLSDEQFAQEQRKADLIQGVHDQVSQAADEDKQPLYQQGLLTLGRAGVDVSKEPPQYPGDDQFAQHLPAIRLHSAILAEAEKDREQTTKEQQATAEQQKANASDWKEGGGGTLINVNPASPHFKEVVHGVGPVDQQEMNSYLTAPTVPGERLSPAQRTPASFVAWKAKQSPMAMVMGNQLPAGPQGNPALDQAAQRYSQTGDLPPGFARSPGTLTAIMNRAAQLNPDANIAGNKAVYGANKTALTQLQAQASKVGAFENTAGKNLDLFLQQADKVTDLGAKFADAPIRTIQRNVLGTGDMAAFDAARTTALTEIAKVLNSPTGAGVLSDSARHEAEGLIGPNATLNSIKRAASILRQDMKNRHDSYQQEIQNLQGTLGGRAQGSQQPNAGGQGSGEGQTATGPNGHKIVVRGGQWVDAQTGAPLR